jgi:hypothetical protein
MLPIQRAQTSLRLSSSAKLRDWQSLGEADDRIQTSIDQQIQFCYFRAVDKEQNTTQGWSESVEGHVNNLVMPLFRLGCCPCEEQPFDDLPDGTQLLGNDKQTWR